MELFKGDVSGGEAGTGFPRMVLIFLSGTMITSNGYIIDRHFRGGKKREKNQQQISILLKSSFLVGPYKAANSKEV